jgi:rubrerythrin
MENLICMNCNFSFKRDKPVNLCPYCNKKAVAKESSAEDIISEVDNLLKE